MRGFRFHLIIAGYCGLLYALVVWFMLWLLPSSSITDAMWRAALLPAALLGDILRLPPAGMHTPNAVAFFAVVIGQGFLFGLALSFAVSAVQRSQSD